VLVTSIILWFESEVKCLDVQRIRGNKGCKVEILGYPLLCLIISGP
jgi:hypothetical protein